MPDRYSAHGRLLTVFSAPDYGARWKNDAAMLVLNRQLHVFPKVVRSRGNQAAQPDWIEDPKRPFTPPRPRRDPGSDPDPIPYDDENNTAGSPAAGGGDGGGGGGGEGGGRESGSRDGGAMNTAPVVAVGFYPAGLEGENGDEPPPLEEYRGCGAEGGSAAALAMRMADSILLD